MREPTCDRVLNLNTPSGSERVRGFQPPWRTVYIYRCGTCGNVIRMRASSFYGTRPTPSIGGIACGGTLVRSEGALPAPATLTERDCIEYLGGRDPRDGGR